MLGAEEAKDIAAFCTRGRHQNLDIHYTSQSMYDLPKNNLRTKCSRIMIFPQTVKFFTINYKDISALHMCFSEWRNFC